jgi:hypothetical protein
MAKDARGHGSDGRGGGLDFGYRPHDPMPMNHTRIGLGTGTPGFSGKILNAGAMTDSQKTLSRVREQLRSVDPQSGHGAGLLQALKNFGRR